MELYIKNCKAINKYGCKQKKNSNRFLRFPVLINSNSLSNKHKYLELRDVQLNSNLLLYSYLFSLFIHNSY